MQGHAQQKSLHPVQAQAHEADRNAGSLFDKAMNHEIAKVIKSLSFPFWLSVHA